MKIFLKDEGKIDIFRDTKVKKISSSEDLTTVLRWGGQGEMERTQAQDISADPVWGGESSKLFLPMPTPISHGCLHPQSERHCETAPKLPGKENQTD